MDSFVLKFRSLHNLPGGVYATIVGNIAYVGEKLWEQAIVG